MEQLKMIACPKCFGELRFDVQTQQFICQHDNLAYPFRDGIPVLLENEAKSYQPVSDNSEL